MSKYIIKAKDGSGWVRGLAPNNNNNKKVIILITTNSNEAQSFPHRKDAKNLLRTHRFATSNYDIEMIESGRNLEFIGHKEYGE